MKTKIINFVMFQLGWLVVVMLGASSVHWAAVLVVAGIVAYHLSVSPDGHRELKLILLALGIGLVWENILTMSGLVVYEQGQILGMFAPVWIIAMWAMLATTLNVSLRWMHGKTALAFLFGAIGGPLAFIAGQKLGAVSFPDFNMAMLALAIGWGVLFTLIMQFAYRHDGFSEMFTSRRMLT